MQSRREGWSPIESAPLDVDIALQVTDGRGVPYTLEFPCRRTAAGCVKSRKGNPLEVTPVAPDDLPPFPYARDDECTPLDASPRDLRSFLSSQRHRYAPRSSSEEIRHERRMDGLL
jgi:hypothetical protein